MYIYAPCDYNYYLQDLAIKWIEEYDFDGENYRDSQEETFPHLKSIMIYGCINEPYVMHMVKFLLRSVVGLEKMVISTKESFEPTHQSKIFVDTIERRKDHYNSEQLLKLSNELISFPRSSSQAMILSPFVCYRFVQV
ncbi:hypothetical protein ACJIZ3_010799 [Penstemon smallii]|uniref:FBD domain-containing protein n=1 Tax=Penstemon smallii TaxID=265156 RepID=A0ABD3UKZ7_9LAMI